MEIFDNYSIRSMPREVGYFDNLSKISENVEEKEIAKDEVSLSTDRKPKYDFTDGNYVEALTTGCETVDKIVGEMSNAKENIMVQVYRLGHEKLVDLLIHQAKNGVNVQVLLDPTPGYDAHDAVKQKAIQDKLEAGGVELLKYPINGPSGKIDHVKLLIVDGKSVVMGGMNWDQHSPENMDKNIYMRGPAVADTLDIWNNDWSQAGGAIIADMKTPGVQDDANAKVRMLTTEVDRKDINTALQANIKGAKKSIRMEAFALADKDTISNLIDAKQRGVDVRVLLDPNKPILFTNLKSAKQLREGGVEVRWLNVDGLKREKLHSKMAVFDDDTTMVGSCNFTKAGLDINHELDAEVLSKEVGKAFIDAFDQTWESRGVERPPDLPDFYEKVGDAPVKEQVAKELFRYFTESFHPGTKRMFVGKRKAAVLEAIDKFDKTKKPAPIEGLGLSGKPELIDDAKQMETIGDLASFFGDVENFPMNPPPGSQQTIYKTRCEISATKGYEVHKNIPRYVNDMVNAIQDKDIKEFVKMALDKAPKGFYEASGSSSGKFHPADEVNPAHVEVQSEKSADAYKGGGLVLHTRRTQKMAELLCDHYGVKGKEKDEILAAMALHDIMKGVTMDEMKSAVAEGREIEWKNTTTPDHGYVAAEWVKSLDTSPGQKLTENIRHLAGIHMGVWNQPESTPPTTVSEFIISMADYSTSQRNMYLEV